MRLLLILSLFVFALPLYAKLSPKHFPVDDALRRRVDFWKRVYTEIGGNEGFLHDTKDLRIIYQKISHKVKGRRARKREINKIRRSFRDRLRAIARKNKSRLTHPEERLLKLVGNPSVKELRRMARRIRYQRGLRDHYYEGLLRSYKFLDHIKKVMRREGLPEELAYLPHVESAFNYAAYSKVGAAGLWQFMRATGRQYRLRVNYLIDERRDPIKSTEAAAKFLRDNYRRLGTWPLALTAYNHGARSVARAVRQVSSRDLSKIIAKYRRRTFGFASQNFYATFVATVEISQEPEKFFGKIPKPPPFAYSVLPLKRRYTLTQIRKITGLSGATLAKYNRSLRRSALKGRRYLPAKFELKVPKASLSVLQGYEKGLASIKQPTRKQQMKTAGRHLVRRGQTLYQISQLYNVPIRDLVALNRISNPSRIPVGTKLKIPAEGDIKKLKTPVLVASRKKRPKIARKVPQKVEPVIAETQKERELEDQFDMMREDRSYPSLALRVEALEGRERTKPGQYTKVDANAPVVGFLAPEQPTVATEYYDLELKKKRRGVYSIVVEAEETLGHFAEWAGVPTQAIRRLNRRRYGRPIHLGQRLNIPLPERKVAEFSAARLEYHAALEEDFYDSYKVTGTRKYVVKRNDTLDGLVREFEVPLWLLRRYQSGSIGSLEVGQVLQIPEIEAISGAN